MEVAQFREMAESCGSASRADALLEFIVSRLRREMEAHPEIFQNIHSQHEIIAAATFRAAA